MSFASLTTPEASRLVERFADAENVTLLVGAGASMEASLPSWPKLVERLLRRVAKAHPALPDTQLEEAWIERTLKRDDLLAAGAIVEAMASDDLDVLLPEELYGADGAAAYEPGPIAHQIARLSHRFGRHLTVMTTNYDDLIERALLHAGIPKKLIKPYITHKKVLATGSVPVTHLHGFAGRDDKPRGLVLTEEHYHRMQRGRSWQEQYVTEQLETTTCLFVGTSLTDSNLIRYLYGYKQSASRSHAVVFVRQGDGEGPSDSIRAVREEAATKRWGRCGVQAIFVDHYAEAAQLLYEIGARRAAGGQYVPLGQRAATALAAITSVALKADADPEVFAEQQVALSRWLRDTLYRTLRAALGGADPPADERLALALWLLGTDGTTLTGWAHSDRAHQDPRTIESVPIRADSTWAAVRAICQGTRVELDRVSDISRWRFVRALPLILDEPRLPIGCLTISSTKPGDTSVLGMMDETAKAALHDGLLAAIQPELARVAP